MTTIYILFFCLFCFHLCSFHFYCFSHFEWKKNAQTHTKKFAFHLKTKQNMFNVHATSHGASFLSFNIFKLFMLVFRLNIDDLKKEEMKMTHAKETKNVWWCVAHIQNSMLNARNMLMLLYSFSLSQNDSAQWQTHVEANDKKSKFYGIHIHYTYLFLEYYSSALWMFCESLCCWWIF